MLWQRGEVLRQLEKEAHADYLEVRRQMKGIHQRLGDGVSEGPMPSPRQQPRNALQVRDSQPERALQIRESSGAEVDDGEGECCTWPVNIHLVYGTVSSLSVPRSTPPK
jgi:hypothetical protein